VLFNVFLNDIFNFVKENKLYNYADDNTLSHSAGCLKTPVGYRGKVPLGGLGGESTPLSDFEQFRVYLGPVLLAIIRCCSCIPITKIVCSSLYV
jgi:hypothetical protein